MQIQKRVSCGMAQIVQVLQNQLVHQPLSAPLPIHPIACPSCRLVVPLAGDQGVEQMTKLLAKLGSIASSVVLKGPPLLAIEFELRRRVFRDSDMQFIWSGIMTISALQHFGSATN